MNLAPVLAVGLLGALPGVVGVQPVAAVREVQRGQDAAERVLRGVDHVPARVDVVREQDEQHRGGRLLQRLEQRVRGLALEVVGGVDDEDAPRRAVRRKAGDAVAARVQVAVDDTISRIVGGWPWRFDTARARALGLAGPANMDEIVAEYVEDYPQAVASAPG